MIDQGRPLAGLAICVLFRGEPDQLARWCAHHLGAGANRLYVGLDRPPAGLADTLPSHPRVEWHVRDQEGWDRLLARSAQTVEQKRLDFFRAIAERASEDGIGHLALLDADELLTLTRPLPEVVSACGDAGALTIPAAAMWRADGDDPDHPFGASLAVTALDPDVDAHRIFGWRAQFLQQGFPGTPEPRTIYRLPLGAGDISGHRPITGALAANATQVEGARVLRYDATSFRGWQRKWLERWHGLSTTAAASDQRRALERMFEQVLRLDDAREEQAYRRFYELTDETQRALSERGQLTAVDPPRPTGDIDLTDLDWPAPDPLPAERRVDFQFAMVCDQRFVKPTMATMLSVVQHLGDRGSIRFVVLGDGIDQRDTAYLQQLVRTPYDVEVRVHDITADLDRDIGRRDEKRATFGRIYLIDHLPPQRTFYLDGDVLATRDFSDVFALDFGDACLAGIPDAAGLRLQANPERVPLEQRNRLLGITDGDPLEYLNGGVLMFDLDHPDFRELALEARSLVFRFGRTLKQRDQDAMNLAFAGRKYRLPHTLNYMTQFYVSDRALDGDLTPLKYAAADATLIHFSGKIKPWVSATDEFYNGLYRKLVVAAEAEVGVSCEFYFSPPRRPQITEIDADQWASILRPAAHPAPQSDESDIEIVDITPTAVYLRLTPDAYDLAVTRGHRLMARSDDVELFDVPLASVSPQLHHLTSRVNAAGLRRLPIAPDPVLDPTQSVEILLVGDEGSRTLAVRDVAFAPDSSASLDLVGATGSLELVSANRELTGWFGRADWSPSDAIALHVDGELVAMRRPRRPRPDLDDPDVRGFGFKLARLDSRGYLTGDLTVTLATTGVPVPGSPVPLDIARTGGTYDTASASWLPAIPVDSPPPSRPLSHPPALRRRLSRVKGWIRA